MKTIPLTKGYSAQIDDEDLEMCLSPIGFIKKDRIRQWCVLQTKTAVYAVNHQPGYNLFLHQAIMQPPAGLEVHHKDRNGLNCQRPAQSEAAA